MNRLLSIWLRNWPIQRLFSEQALQQKLLNEPDSDSRTAHVDSRPIILWRTDPRRGRLVVACCRRARSLGVRVGIPIAQATELVTNAKRRIRQPASAARQPTDLAGQPADSAPAIILEHDPIADSIALDAVASALQQNISPMVAVEALDRRLWAGQVMLESDTLFCDLSGVTHLFADEMGILSATHRCLKQFNLIGKLAIAQGSAAAWAHAHYNPQPDFIANDPPIDLAPLSVNGLRIETETKYTLDRLGIETIGQVLRLPRSGLASRLGEPLVGRIAEVLGEVEVPMSIHAPLQEVTESETLEYPTDDLEIVQYRIDQLTSRLVSSLTTLQRGALRVACRLKLSDQSTVEAVIGLFAPTMDHKHLLGLFSAALESRQLAAPITKVSLVVLQSGPLRTTQHGLFTEEAVGIEGHSTNHHALGRLVDGLTSRLGRDAVQGVRLTDNPLPEKAYRTYSLTDHRTRKAIRRLPSKAFQRKPSTNQEPSNRSRSWHSFRKPTTKDARRRPLKLLRRPIPITAVWPEGQPVLPKSNRLPAFRTSNQTHHIERFWGPERIETGWWSGPTVRRDYYRVETNTGRLWWIFRDLRQEDQWYLHGRFV